MNDNPGCDSEPCCRRCGHWWSWTAGHLDIGCRQAFAHLNIFPVADICIMIRRWSDEFSPTSRISWQSVDCAREDEIWSILFYWFNEFFFSLFDEKQVFIATAATPLHPERQLRANAGWLWRVHLEVVIRQYDISHATATVHSEQKQVKWMNL